MRYCFHPQCEMPHHLDGTDFCRSCGTKLLLKERYRAIKLLGGGVLGRTFLGVDEDKPSKPLCVIKQIFFQPNFNFTTEHPFPASEQPQPGLIEKNHYHSAQDHQNLDWEFFNHLTMKLDELGQHPQIPNLLAAFGENGHQYFVQEYIEGRNLAEELGETGAFTEVKIRQLLKSLLPVLQVMHDHQLIHRDIKPENIIRRRSHQSLVNKGYLGDLSLVDFGAAISVADRYYSLTNTIVGSAEYAAPEQTKGQAVISSDLYSLGITCIHLLTEQSPFTLFDPEQDLWVWRYYLDQEHKWRSGKAQISESLAKIIDKLIEKSPKKRYQSATEVMKDLNHWMISAPEIPQKTKLAVTALGGAAIAIFFATLTTHIQYINPIPKTSFNSPEIYLSQPSSTDLSFPQHQLQLWQNLTGVNGPVWSLAISPDGKTLASGSYKDIKLWQLGKNETKMIISGHTGPVWSIAISPNGKLLASGSEDHTIKLWNIQKSQLLATLNEHSAGIFAIAFSPDHNILASGSADQTIKLWNVTTGELIRTLRGHSGEVQSVAFSPDGKILASGSTDGTVKVWNLSNGELIHTLIGHTDAVWSVAISPDGKTIASGSWDHQIKLWNINTGKQIQTLISHTDKVQSVTFSPDGHRLASGDFAGTIKLWDLTNNTAIDNIKAHSALVQMVFSQDGKAIASGSFDHTIKIWRVSP